MRIKLFAFMPLFSLLILAGCTASDTESPVAAPSQTESTSEADDAQYKGQTDEEIAAAGPPERGGKYVKRLQKEPNTLCYILDTSDVYTFEVMRQVQETLIEMDPATLDFTPALAERWEISDDKLTYTFYLNPKAVFSDGKPVTTEDVKFTFDTILDEKNECADIRGYIKDITGIEVIDEHTIQFTVAKQYFKHLDMIGGSIPIYAKHVYGEGDFNTHPKHRAVFGSGPYQFEKWETNSEILLTRNPNYWGADDKAYVDELSFKIISDDDAGFQVAERGEIDYGRVMPERWVTRVVQPDFQENYRGVKSWATDGYFGGYGYICWNTRKPQFEDKRVRQALTMLMDREGFVKTIYHGLGKVVSGPLAWKSPGYDQSIEPWPYNPTRAKALLDEAGWVDSDGDNIRDKDGVKLEFEFMLTVGRRETERFITVYKEELERAGIMMNIRPIEWASMLESLVNREFEATTLRWAIPVDSDPYQLWHSSQVDTGSNYPGLVSDELDSLIEAARLEFDRDKRSEYYHKVHAIIHEEQPYTFLWNVNELVFVHRRFQGVKLHDIGLDSLEWWVPQTARLH